MLAERIRRVSPSATLEISAKAKEMKARGEDVINLSAGEPDFPPPEEATEEVCRAVRKGYGRYTASQGIEELRSAIAEKLRRENGIECTPEQVIVTPGAKMAIYAAVMVLVDPGDEVLIPEPWWVSYPAMVELAEGRAVYVPTKEEEGFRLTPEAVSERITSKTKVLILNTPCNPTGAVMREQELRGIAELCQDHGIYVISDEIYEYMVYDGARHVSIGSFDGMEELCITVNGFSKSYCMTGWRIGYAAGKEEIIKAMTRLQAHSVSNVTTFVQHAGIKALGADMRLMLDEFDRRRRYMVEELRKMPGVRCIMPEGAFYVFPNFSAYGGDSKKLAMYLLEEAKVATVPGAAFGREGHLRLSYAVCKGAIAEGLSRIRSALEGLEHESDSPRCI